MFSTNVGFVDRILRVIIGAALLYWFFTDGSMGPWHYAKLIGIIPLVSGLFATCPIYAMLGVPTCPHKS